FRRGAAPLAAAVSSAVPRGAFERALRAERGVPGGGAAERRDSERGVPERGAGASAPRALSDAPGGAEARSAFGLARRVPGVLVDEVRRGHGGEQSLELV